MRFDQVAILIFSCLSILLFSTKKAYRFGFVAGLCGQPFWIYSSLCAEQWGIFAVSLWYTFFHIKGIMTHWRVK